MNEILLMNSDEIDKSFIGNATNKPPKQFG